MLGRVDVGVDEAWEEEPVVGFADRDDLGVCPGSVQGREKGGQRLHVAIHEADDAVRVYADGAIGLDF